MSIVRQATDADIYACKVLGWMAFQESCYSHLTPDFGMLENLIDTTNAYNIWVAEAENGELCGFLIAHIQRGLFFKEKIVSNTLWYVVPEKRGTNVPFRLMREMEKWAILNECVEIHIATAGGTRTDQTARMLERIGHTIVGINTTKELPHGQFKLRSSRTDAGREAAAGASASDERAPAGSDGRAASAAEGTGSVSSGAGHQSGEGRDGDNQQGASAWFVW